MDPIDALRQLEERLHSELLLDARYVALLGVRRTIKDTIFLLEEKEKEQQKGNPPLPLIRVRERTSSSAAQTSPSGSPSQADAAFAVLSDSTTPLPIVELVPLVRARGATVGGSNPELNLSSSLSRDGRFGSMRFNSRPCWAIKGKPYMSNQPIEPVTEDDHLELMGSDSTGPERGGPVDDIVS